MCLCIVQQRFLQKWNTGLSKGQPYGVDDQALPSHQESCEEEPDLPVCYLFIILYQ